MKKTALALALMSVVLVDKPYAYQVEDIAKQGIEIQNNASRYIDSDWLSDVAKRGNPLQAQWQDIANASSQNALASMQSNEASEQDKAVMKGYKYLIFASYSLGKEGLRELLFSASGKENAAVVFRGVPEGKRIDEAIQDINELARQVYPVPNVILDPSAFKEYDVQVVPTLVARDDENRAIAIVKGIHSIDWVNDQIAAGKTGDLGFLGSAELIAERDLIEVMMERAQAIDWEEKGQKALDRAWTHVKFARLPHAPKDRTRLISASVQVMEDIKIPSGEFIARAGDVINPLEARPFTTAYIIFNPKRPSEKAFAIQKKQEILQEGKYRNVVFMFTDLEVGEDGWESFQQLTNQLDTHIFSMTPEVQQRFFIEHTPSVVIADDKNFIVQEFYVPDNQISKE